MSRQNIQYAVSIVKRAMLRIEGIYMVSCSLNPLPVHFSFVQKSLKSIQYRFDSTALELVKRTYYFTPIIRKNTQIIQGLPRETDTPDARKWETASILNFTWLSITCSHISHRYFMRYTASDEAFIFNLLIKQNKTARPCRHTDKNWLSHFIF